MKNDGKTDPNSNGTMTVSFFGSFPQITEQDASIPSSGQRFCAQPTYAQSRSSQRWPFTRGRCCQALLERHPELQDSFLPEIGSIVSAACLAHDLGNPPFGHSGEKAISTFFSEGKGVRLKEKQPNGEQLSPMEWEDLTHFEGNANAFRILTHQFEDVAKADSS